MTNVSAGVYSKIIDLSTYVQSVPSTIGCIMSLAQKGKDNQLTFVGSRSELISGWGEPDIRVYGKQYGQGPYEAYNFLGESGALYFMRCLPNDATFACLRIDATLASSDSTAAVSVSYTDSLNSVSEIKTNLASSVNTYPLGFLYPVGRGEYYNGISVRLTEYSNPMYSGIYVLDVYEKQSDGDDVIVESFEVSFDPKVTDQSGDSIFIGYILETYSAILRFEMTLASGAYTSGYELLSKIYDKEIGSITMVETNGSASISDNKQLFSDWETDPETGNATYMLVAKDSRGNILYGWLGASTGVDNDSINVFDGRDLDTASQNWVGDTSSFDSANSITYEIKKSNTSIADAFVSSIPVPLKRGTDGTLRDESGDLDTTVATQVLSGGYAGTLTNPITGETEDIITDTENLYFTLVFDAGYPSSVKTQISTLAQTRRDCVAINDNGDNASYTTAISSRVNTHTFNNFYTAIYEGYSKVYDIFTGQEIWVSPLFHMSYLLPRNDSVSEIWYAAAGFNRAAIDSIKELRYNPKLGQRDEFYLKQLNEIVKFSSGHVVWSQLTSQAKPSALQDLNIVRLVLYIKKSLEQFAQFFIFELNDAVTWNSFNNEVVAFLESVKIKRGLYSYSTETSATDYERKRKTFHCNVILEPTRVVEKIELNFFIK